MWQFRVPEVGFLGCIIILDAISMEHGQISTIEARATSESVWEVVVLLALAHCNTIFIPTYGNVTALTTNWLKTPGSQKLAWTQDAEFPLRKLKKAISKSPFL
jgi:hypothetical protein